MAPQRPIQPANKKGDTIPFFLDGADLVFWPGLWRTSAHMYANTNPYRFRNESARENQTKPVLCGFADKQPCGPLLGNSSYNGLNKSIVNAADYLGSSTILINSTFPNGTTATGGTGDVGLTSDAIPVDKQVGFWLVAAIALATVFAA
ncbi:hypothetical protein QIS74_13650 [Colletotrichum tabaci]|uniref:DUF7732 domain-containing protein n=1 Tax=Colletotrichum tabaci TaxID=1209068 RepID=A0AAV9SSP2_9PEZI